jgi:ActR/RegA family two-component response regulator
VLTTPGASILPADLEIPAMDESPEALCDFRSGRTLAIEKFEAEYVRRLLARHNGNVTRAAREAGKERRAFGRLVKKYTA